MNVEDPVTTSDEVLDVLIAGGGPGGTAVAFHARELGLTALVIEYDDLMKRIRDYSKDKMILPSFGGGDRMKFPLGGDLVSSLRFAPIDKDDMCSSWKGLYGKHGVAIEIGVELTGLECASDGAYTVHCWDHGAHAERRFRARNVVVAIGRGVPRRFDIPGSTDGIAFRLDDPDHYLGAPVCVLGGGTSAAEAVIALAQAKVAADDNTAVYWSYRGDRMPRVSKALAEVFFEAYVGCGNIRYYPRSEPVAVVTGDDRKEYLSVRFDRQVMEGRPAETAHLEFPKERCIACIGEDIPEKLLAALGIRMALGGPRNKKRMVVNRFLETERANVFLIGDILSQAYFETANFKGDPAGFREVKHRGNIKSALRDGVFVAKVIHQRAVGRPDAEVIVEDAEDLVGEGTVLPAPGRSGPQVERAEPIAAVERAMAPPASRGPDPSSQEAAGYLIRVLPGGIEEREHAIGHHDVVAIGRTEGDLIFSDDTLLSRRHASVSHTEEGFFLRDDGSAGGVFLSVPSNRKIALRSGDLLCVGRQFLLVGGEGAERSLTHYDAEGQEVRRHQLEPRAMIAGRRAPDIQLDPEDRTLSRRQLAFSLVDGEVMVKDLKTVNGSFLRVRSAVELVHDDRFRAGQQTFVFSKHRDAVLDVGQGSSVLEIPQPTAPSVPAPASATATQDIAGDGPSVTFAGLGQAFPAQVGQTICEVAEANGVALNAECHAGICGSDPVRILSGRENLSGGPDDEESDTLEELCGVEPGPCRLACKARIKGPVTVEIL